MSAEMITTIVGVVSMLLALAGGFGWMINRTDAQFAEVRRDLGARIDKTNDELGARIDKTTGELVEVKIALARVEGPSRHLVTGR